MASRSRSRPPLALILLFSLLVIANLFSQLPSCIGSQNNKLVFALDSLPVASENPSEGVIDEVADIDIDIVDELESSASPNDSLKQKQQQQHKPRNPLLPEKLFVIYGLESSGTTFTSKTVASALGINTTFKDYVESADNKIHIHHLSLPLGTFSQGQHGARTRFTKPLQIVPVYYPKKCRPPPFGNKPPQLVQVQHRECKEFLGEQVMQISPRYFVNITSHVQWYRERDVEVYPIMVSRDSSFRFLGVLKQHCKDKKAAYQQYETGREIMLRSMATVEPIMFSYETLMTIQDEYLLRLYQQLNITTDYFPPFKDGNLKHVRVGNVSTYIQTEMYREEKLNNPDMSKVFDKGAEAEIFEQHRAKIMQRFQKEKEARKNTNGGSPRMGAVTGKMYDALPDKQKPKQNVTALQPRQKSFNTAAAQNSARLEAKLEQLRNDTSGG